MEISPKTYFRLVIVFILLVLGVMLFLVWHASNQGHFIASNNQGQEIPADSLPKTKPNKKDSITPIKAIEKEKQERIEKERKCIEYTQNCLKIYNSPTEFDANYAHNNIYKMEVQCKKYCSSCDFKGLKFKFSSEGYNLRLMYRSYIDIKPYETKSIERLLAEQKIPPQERKRILAYLQSKYGLTEQNRIAGKYDFYMRK